MRQPARATRARRRSLDLAHRSGNDAVVAEVLDARLHGCGSGRRDIACGRVEIVTSHANLETEP